MSGLELKEFLKSKNIKIVELCECLGISMQLANSLFKAQDVKSGTLEKIAQVYGKDIRWFYGLDKEQPVENKTSASDNSIAVTGDGNSITAISERFIGLLEEKDRQIASLLRMVANKKD